MSRESILGSFIVDLETFCILGKYGCVSNRTSRESLNGLGAVIGCKCAFVPVVVSLWIKQQ